MFQNLDILREFDPDFVLILAGDHIYKMDYGKHARLPRGEGGGHDRGLHRRSGRGSDRRSV